jgi:hypothetical protein
MPDEREIYRKAEREALREVAGERAGPDAWVARSQGMRCRTCVFYVLKRPTEPTGGLKPPQEIGRCRRHAPTMSGYPAVFPSDWCGDHKLDENRV